MNKVQNVSKEDLVKAYQVSAELVAEYGAEYVPAFERMEKELAQAGRLDEAVARAEQAVNVEPNIGADNPRR